MVSRLSERFLTWHARIEDRLDLRQQVAIATGILCVGLVLLLAAVAAVVGRSEAKKAASDTLNDIALTLADRMESGVGFYVTFAENVARLEPLSVVWSGNADDIRDVLTELRGPLSRASWIGFAGADGVVRASADGSREGTSVADVEWFRSGLTGTTITQGITNAEADAAAVERHVVDIGVPVRGMAGETVGVLGIYLGPAWTERLRVSTVGGRTENDGIELVAMQPNGDVILGDASLMPPVSTAMRDAMFAEQSGVLPDDGGLISAFAVARLVAGGSVNRTWLVIASQKPAVAFATANHVTLVVAASGLVAALVGIAGAAMIAGRVSQPFRRLAEGAEKVRLEASTNLPRVHGSVEAVRLSTTLRALISRLRDARRTNIEIEDRAAAEHVRLNRDIAALRNLAEVDVLTGLLNRRKFLEVGAMAVDDHRLQGRGCALLMIDIDHFKRVNDTHGHAVGDDALRIVAAILAANQTPADHAARLGGEEFAVLLADTDYHAALSRAEHLRQTIEAAPLMVSTVEVALTVSVGLAVCTLGDRNIADLMQRADIGLYAAKAAGRNRVELAPVETREFARRA